jgi:hypothetical protein
MRAVLFFSLSLLIVGCNDSNKGKGNPDMAGRGGAICPDHPENCEGQCCGSTCVNTMDDKANCGGCNVACDPGTVCMGGHCGCLPTGAPCAATQTCCPNAGCADLMNDIRNCGQCGHSCGDGSTCEQGVCKCGGSTCSATQVCCSGSCADSCMTTPMDMSMSSGLPLCDCTGLDPDPLGTGVMDQCPGTDQCVRNNCCQEDVDLYNQFGFYPPGTCEDSTPCQTSLTPQ